MFVSKISLKGKYSQQ